MGNNPSTIKKRLGAQWNQLHPNIQARFACDPKDGEIIHYHGNIDVSRSRAGWLFAQLTRIIGNPLAPFKGQHVPLDVKLFTRPNQQGVFWERTYHFEKRKPFVVTSVKKEGRAHEDLLECVGGGFGMVLNVTAEDKALHFRSEYYFLEWLGFRVRLPHWVTPGATHVVHEDKREGNFRFTITMTHCALGQTFHQSGIFCRKGE